jgi:hypothetical protein
MKKLNGWQRLWAVVTIILALWFVFLSPIKTMNETSSSNTTFQSNLLADFDGGACQHYINASLEDLVEPPYGDGNGGTCWHIYTTRMIDKVTAAPFTKEDAKKHDLLERLGIYVQLVLIGILLVFLSSGFLYLIGLTAGWIRRGFSTNKD